MSTFRFLHLTDLHIGMSGQSHLWPNVEERILGDLKMLSDQVGPWDLVLFTGVLTQRGTDAEFASFDGPMRKLWGRFAEWGFTPLKTIASLPEDRQAEFLWRLVTIRDISHNFGYGVGDDMDACSPTMALIAEPTPCDPSR